MLTPAVLAAFSPAVLALAAKSGLSRDLLEISLTGLFTTTLVFFNYISDRLFKSNLRILSYQSEKDDLIAELEVAKSMSDEARRRAEEANLAKSRFLASMTGSPPTGGALLYVHQIIAEKGPEDLPPGLR